MARLLCMPLASCATINNSIIRKLLQYKANGLNNKWGDLYRLGHNANEQRWPIITHTKSIQETYYKMPSFDRMGFILVHDRRDFPSLRPIFEQSSSAYSRGSTYNSTHSLSIVVFIARDRKCCHSIQMQQTIHPQQYSCTAHASHSRSIHVIQQWLLLR